ncbi:3225_t:CDS:2 [Paraglomus brasilianum]|uniref:3225_t:CDS:1 n=1 Tax=Paraglomus brasilianum TaxID=144538 RepID=A0A9N9GHK7_9GLOM|nr:3225_t:CDS:2 [Paraglomus brasilianum]
MADNPIALTAAASLATASRLMEGTQRLLFHQLQTRKEGTNSSADYVIVVKTKQNAEEDKDQLSQRLRDTCLRIMTQLNGAGLKFEVRRGSKEFIFFFVLCSTERLKLEVRRARLADWLTGVRIRDVDDDSADGSDSQLTEAERLRLVYDIITNPRSEGGADIKPGSDKLELVGSLLPLHDRVYNDDWIKSWSTKWIINKNDLMSLRNHFGEKIAYYFAFLQYYALWLIAPSIAEFWKRKERELSILWGTRNFSRFEKRRPAFREEKYVKNPITGELQPYFPPWKRWLRRAIAAPVIIVFSFTLATALIFYILLEVIVSEYYTGPFREQVIYLPTVIYCILVPAINIVYNRIARQLNEYENHETESYHEYNLSQKIFIANFLIGYLSLFFIGWVYIPYNKEIGEFFHDLAEILGLSITVKPVGSERLKNELKYFIITAQVINFVTEVVLPYALRYGEHCVQKAKSLSNTSSDNNGVNEDEAGFLKRVKREVDLPVYDIYEDYAEMILQYGYVSLFAVVWPLTPICAFVNNWIELRSDAIKLCAHTRRPIPARADSIGPWLDSLTIITWLATITNPSFVYLYHPSSNAFASPSAMLVTVTLIWFAEHILNVLRYALQQMLNAFPSWADELVQKEEYELKKRWTERVGIAPVLSLENENHSEASNKEKSELLRYETTHADHQEILKEILEHLKME